jgi:hypothetical protein
MSMSVVYVVSKGCCVVLVSVVLLRASLSKFGDPGHANAKTRAGNVASFHSTGATSASMFVAERFAASRPTFTVA